MSPTANQLTNKNAVFNEWIAKYPELKTYIQQGLARTLSVADLLGFTARTLLGSKQPNNLSPAPSQTPSTYTVQFDPTTGNADKSNLVRALQKGQKGGPSATNSISLFIAWEQEGAASATRPPNWQCASVRF
jgi:hypothetical protein